jgi:acyl-coenzyme A synthetase/AMP-(fatty) acid ligase
VQVAHESVVALLHTTNAAFERRPGTRCSCHAPLHFDVSVWDVFATLSTGGELHLVPAQASLLPAGVVQFMAQHRLTHWASVPSALMPVAQVDGLRHVELPELQRLIWYGEPFPMDGLRYWMERLPHVRFTNAYGPTETTIVSACHHLERAPGALERSVSVGRPLAGERFLIVDAEGREAPTDVAGELLIGGVGVALGYIGDPARTAQSFIELEQDGQRQRWYKTGDWVRRDPQGNFHLLGRFDRQVKVQGYRIELDEVQTALEALGDVAEAAVVVARGTAGAPEIVAACVPSGAARPEPIALRRAAAELLPRYMLPRRWRFVSALPRTSTGKLDLGAVRAWFELEPDARPGASP